MNFHTKLNRISYNGDKKDRAKESRERGCMREKERSFDAWQGIRIENMSFCDIICNSNKKFLIKEITSP